MKKPFPHILALSLFLIIAGAAMSPARSDPGAVPVDTGAVPHDLQDRNLMVACVMSELGQWKTLDSTNIKDKAVAISYVILRRTLNGTPRGQHTIKETLLAPHQFSGLSLKLPNSGRYKGKPEIHAALASLDPAYRTEIETKVKTHPTPYLRDVMHLLPSDSSKGDDAAQFQRALRAAAAGVDAVLSGHAKDLSNGAQFFGGVGDIFRTKDHWPTHIVSYVGGLGHFSSIKALVSDPHIRSGSYRTKLRDSDGVDAIFFFR